MTDVARPAQKLGSHGRSPGRLVQYRSVGRWRPGLSVWSWAETDLFGPTRTLLDREAARTAGDFVRVVGLRSAPRNRSTPASTCWPRRQRHDPDRTAHPRDRVHRRRLRRPTPRRHRWAAESTRHLVDLGRSIRRRATGRPASRRAGTPPYRALAGPTGWFDAGDRIRGWRAELDSHGLRGSAPNQGDWSADSGFAIGQRIPPSELPDAIFVANDLMALGLIHGLTARGVDVLGDISLVGYGDIDGSAWEELCSRCSSK